MGVPLLADEKGPEKYLTEKRRVFFSNCKKMMLAKKEFYTLFLLFYLLLYQRKLFYRNSERAVMNACATETVKEL